MKPIPKHFHFVFGLKPQNDPFHIAYYLCLQSCISVNQPDRISFYYHYEPYGQWWERIKPALNLVLVDLEDFVLNNKSYLQHQEGQFITAMQLNYAHQADFIRLRVLIEHGGVYADMDTLFVNPLPEFLFKQDFVMGEESEISDEQGNWQRSLCNALILSQPQARFPRRWLDNMFQVFDGSWSQHSCKEASKLSLEFPDEICVVPECYFYKNVCTPEGIAKLFEHLDTDFAEVYSMHLWGHLWWDIRRVDFSTFHAGLLTEGYIRQVDTTYSVIARRFLPG